MIRSKGEAGTGNIVEAVRHLRSILGDHPRSSPRPTPPSSTAGPRSSAPRSTSCRRSPRPGSCPSRCSAPAASPPRPTPRSSCSSAREAVFVGSGIFKSVGPGPHGLGHRRGHHPFRRRRASWRRCPGASVRRCGVSRRRSTASISPTGGGSEPLVGCPCDLQGDVREHLAALAEVGCTARRVQWPADLEGLSGLVLPGGESTTLSMLLESTGLFEAVAARVTDPDRPLPLLGTCAGLVLVAREVLDGRPDQRHLRRARRGRAPQRLRAPEAVLRSRHRVRLRRGPAPAHRLHPGPAAGLGRR